MRYRAATRGFIANTGDAFVTARLHRGGTTNNWHESRRIRTNKKAVLNNPTKDGFCLAFNTG